MMIWDGNKSVDNRATSYFQDGVNLWNDAGTTTTLPISWTRSGSTTTGVTLGAITTIGISLIGTSALGAYSYVGKVGANGATNATTWGFLTDGGTFSTVLAGAGAANIAVGATNIISATSTGAAVTGSLSVSATGTAISAPNGGISYGGHLTTGAALFSASASLSATSPTMQTITTNGLTVTMPAPFAGGMFIFNLRGMISTTFAYGSAILYSRGSLMSSYSYSASNGSSITLTSDGTYWFVGY
jgi:hypothetical protein